MPLQVSGGGFSFSLCTSDGTWGWSVRASNVRGIGQLYDVHDVRSPWGVLTSAEILIPGDVIAAMAESLRSLQGQLAPALTLAPPAQSSFSVTVEEGGAPASFGPVIIQNSGAFGSFMGVVVTPSAPWLSASPSSIQGIGQGQQGLLSMSVLPGTLLASSSPYAGTVNIQDGSSPPTVIPVSVVVTVLPRPSISVTSLTVTLTYSIGSAAAGGAESVIVGNSGPPGSSLEWFAAKIQNSSPWLHFTPAMGGPIIPGASEPLTFSVVPAGVTLIPGTYMETVRLASRSASNSPVDVVVSLIVTP
jgi:hypothetical protein